MDRYDIHASAEDGAVFSAIDKLSGKRYIGHTSEYLGGPIFIGVSIARVIEHIIALERAGRQEAGSHATVIRYDDDRLNKIEFRAAFTFGDTILSDGITIVFTEYHAMIDANTNRC